MKQDVLPFSKVNKIKLLAKQNKENAAKLACYSLETEFKTVFCFLVLEAADLAEMAFTV